MRISAIVVTGILAVNLAGGFASAADKPLTPQQQRMADCNKQATGKKGDERKTFMKSCLKGESAPAAKMTQQDKMKECNKQAAGKKGDERKKFMSDCLKGS